MADFAQWLQQMLDDRGWTRSEAARRGGVSPAAYDRILNDNGKPGLDFFKAVSRAFRVPLEDVLREAGVLPSTVPGDRTVAGIVGQLNEQSPEVRAAVVEIIQRVLSLVDTQPKAIIDFEGFTQLVDSLSVEQVAQLDQLLAEARQMQEQELFSDAPANGESTPAGQGKVNKKRDNAGG